jgi:hypothetical protein
MTKFRLFLVLLLFLSFWTLQTASVSLAQTESLLTIVLPENVTGNIRNAPNTQSENVGSLADMRGESIDIIAIEVGENIQGESLWISFVPSGAITTDPMWISLILLPTLREEIHAKYDEVVAQQMSELTRETIYNNLPSEIREMVDSGVAFYDESRRTFARQRPDDSSITEYWAGGMDIVNDLPAGYWVEEVDNWIYEETQTRIIVRMNVERMRALENNSGYYDLNLVNENGASLERWLNSTYAYPLRHQTITIDLLANRPRGRVWDSIITTIQIDPRIRAVLLAVSVARTTQQDIHVKLYCPPIYSMFWDVIQSNRNLLNEVGNIENLEFADESWLSNCIEEALYDSAYLSLNRFDNLAAADYRNISATITTESYIILRGNNSDAYVRADLRSRIVDIRRD